jgi:hypothetical protein
MADLLKILKERQVQRPLTSAIVMSEQAETANLVQPALLSELVAMGNKPTAPLAQPQPRSAAEDEGEMALFSPQMKQAQEVARRTRELLDSRGWCLWKCNTLRGDIIAVVTDETVEGVPEGYPIYTEGELQKLCQNDVSEATLRLVHEAKRLAGAKVTSEV